MQLKTAQTHSVLSTREGSCKQVFSRQQTTMKILITDRWNQIINYFIENTCSNIARLYSTIHGLLFVVASTKQFAQQFFFQLAKYRYLKKELEFGIPQRVCSLYCAVYTKTRSVDFRTHEYFLSLVPQFEMMMMMIVGVWFEAFVDIQKKKKNFTRGMKYFIDE